MAGGIRIRHTELRGPMVVVVRDMSRRMKNRKNRPWPGCGICEIPSPGHDGYETRHVRIDSEGYALVSVAYWEALEAFIDKGGFEYINDIPNPPRQSVDILADGSARLTVHHKMTRPILLTEKGKQG